VKTKVHAVVVDLDDSTALNQFIINDEIPDAVMAEPHEEPDCIP
jgi:hypothetical protein